MRLKNPVLYLILAIILVVAALLTTRPEQQVVLKQRLVPVVETVAVRKQDVRPAENIAGRLLPAKKSTLHFEVEGVVSRRLVREGAKVSRGELLLQLQDDDYRDRVDDAKALLEQEKQAIERDRRLRLLARENVVLSKNEVKRLQRLGKKSLSSESALDDARKRLLQLKSELANLEFAVKTADQRLASRQSALNRAERNLARTGLRAPYDGRVNAVFVEEGDRVTPATAVLEMIDDRELELQLKVSRRAIMALKSVSQVPVRVDDETFRGDVVAWQRDPDPETFTYEVRIRLTGDSLLAGTVATVELPLRPALGAMVIPQSAILYEAGKSWIFVVDGAVLKKRRIETGIRHLQSQVVLDGLSVGQQIVARDVAALSDGQKVVVR